LYHIYNRGNNRKLLFYEPKNYTYFLKKVRFFIAPYCDLLGYSLLPNHFHFLVHANEESVTPWRRTAGYDTVSDVTANIQMSQLSHGFQMCLSSYAKGMNHQYGRTGSLFTQNTRCKQTSAESHLDDYSVWCFNYIHNNPVAAGLTTSPDQWPYSSYKEYLGITQDCLCNIALGRQLLRLDLNPLSSYGQPEIPDFILRQIL
jgi:REP element-mobilizing transposase RayT